MASTCTQLLLADEINRTPPKTQAALLEAMGEGQVSVDGQTRRLPAPFVVLATDNPIEYEGTYELPEAQLDRFLMRLRLGYLSTGDETAMLARRVARAADYAELTAVSSADDVLEMRQSLEQVEVTQDLLEYIVAIVNATRNDAQVQVGASPRGGLALVQLARGQALLSRCDYVVPDDIKKVAVPALAHPARPWHTAVLGAALTAYLLTVHLADSGAPASTLRPQALVLAVGACLLALGAGAGMLPAIAPGPGSALLRVVAAVAVIVAAGMVLPHISTKRTRS
jgi:MoxR-like ATPase